MSVLNEDIYELCDLHQALEDKNFKLAEKIVFQFAEVAGLKIAEDSPFMSSFFCRTADNRYISYTLDAPAGVLITTNGKKSMMNLYLNPIIIDRLFSVVEDNKGNFFDHFEALMKHEMLHLIWEHQAEEEEFLGKDNRDHRLCNIAQDSKINESDEIAGDEFVEQTGIKFKSLKDYGYKGSKDVFDNSNWFQVFSGLDRNKDNNSLQAKGQGGQNKDNGSSKNDNSSQDDVLHKMPKDAKDKNGNSQKDKSEENTQVANPSQVRQIIESNIKEAATESGEDEDNLKSRGIIPGHILERTFHRAKVKEVINIKEYYRHGIHNILKTRKKNFRHLKLNTHSFGFKNTLKREKGKEILAYIDTSGSISNSEVSFFLTQLYNVAKNDHVELKAIPWGTEVHHSQEKIIKGNSSDFSFSVEEGGTCANCVFEDLIKQKCDPENQFVIILTDGETEEISKENYGKYGNDVLWIIDDESEIDENDEEEMHNMYPGTIAYLNQDKEFIQAFPNKAKVN